MLVTDCLRHSHHCVGQGASEASSLTYPFLIKLMKSTLNFMKFHTSAASGLKSGQSDRKRNFEKANIEYRISNVEVMYSVYFKKRQSAATPSFRIPHSLRGVGPDRPLRAGGRLPHSLNVVSYKIASTPLNHEPKTGVLLAGRKWSCTQDDICF